MSLAKLLLLYLLFAFADLPARSLAADPGEPPPAETARDQRRSRGAPGNQNAYKVNIVPHWFQEDTRLWYRNDLKGGAREFILVDVEKGERGPAFDHKRLAAALSKAAGREFKPEQLPFTEIEFLNNCRVVKFQAADKTWKCDLQTYECTAGEQSSVPSAAAGTLTAAATSSSWRSPAETAPAETSAGRRSRRPGAENVRSPDGKWSAFTLNNNVFIRSEADQQEFALSNDGVEGNAYGRLTWAPDSQALVAWRIEPGERKEVYLVRSSPPGGGRATLSSRPYTLPGDKFTRYEVNLFDVSARKQIKPEVDLFEHEWEAPRLRWNRDSRHFTYQKVDRGHQRLRLIEVNSLTGALRNLIDEQTDTFIWTAHTENLNVSYITWLEKTDEILYISEKDGWRHLYLVDARDGTIKHQITRGEYVVRGVEKIDEDKRQLWFRASGRNPGESPYNMHYYRVNFDGGGLIALTEGNGTHTIQFSPSRKYLIDTFSRVDAPPVHILRTVSDPTTICELEKADISELQAGGWAAPEVFVAKGRDGKTDIYGIIARPRDFDPSKKYPVIEQIYAGPQSSYVPKSFSSARRFANLTDLGFIVVQIDGMGTADRSKAFHDVCWKNLKDAGFPDRILWHKAVAAKYPYYDISRVGIYGTSAGGQNAAGALLFHPEFYKAAVANCGCHDNRMDKASWNEQWMGYPVGPHYSESSNIDNAAKLQGHLMLVVGEVDDNVPPESTYRLVDALIRANKDFDLLVVPNGGHGAGGAYGQRRLQDFFVRYLQGIQPLNRNSTGSAH
jgi:dipeptidyl aminopeptidase/acylaminoacyl peptidase